MVHLYWLLSAGVWRLNTVTDAKDPVIINATFSLKSNLGECQSCLTNIAGVDRRSLASISTHHFNPRSTAAIFQAFGGNASSFKSRD